MTGFVLQASALPMESLVVGLAPDGNWRGLRNIFDDVTPDMGWSYFANVYAELGEVSLGGVDWDAILNTLWREVMQRHHLDVGPMYRLDAWEEVLRVCGLLDEDGFLRRIVDWGAADDNVERWLHGDRPISRNTADLGGWLADYVNTLYQKRRGGVRGRVKYVSIHNAIYRSMYRKFGFALALSANTAGNIFEHLCWHAFEHHRGELVLAIVWHAAKGARDQQSHASLSGTHATLHSQEPFQSFMSGQPAAPLRQPANVGLQSIMSGQPAAPTSRQPAAPRRKKTSKSTGWKQVDFDSDVSEDDIVAARNPATLSDQWRQRMENSDVQWMPPTLRLDIRGPILDLTPNPFPAPALLSSARGSTIFLNPNTTALPPQPWPPSMRR